MKSTERVGEKVLVGHSVQTMCPRTSTPRVLSDESLAALRERVLNESHEAQRLAGSTDELRNRDRANP